MEKVECPKCGSSGAWFKSTPDAVILKCLCGLNRVVCSKLEDGISLERIDSKDEISLPRFDSKLWHCLQALVGLEEATTGEITDCLNRGKPPEEQQSSSNVASHLTVLRYKGLVETKVDRKGVVGGSTWVPTGIVLKKFNKGVR